jgi:hypothetical protein
MEKGTSYHYFLHFSDDTVQKTCQALQIIAWAGLAAAAGAPDYKSRVETIKNNKERVLDELRDLCQASLLRVSFLVDNPTVCYRVHNASNSALATVYTKYYEKGFVRWSEGQRATILPTLRTKSPELRPDHIDAAMLASQLPANAACFRVENCFPRACFMGI